MKNRQDRMARPETREDGVEIARGGAKEGEFEAAPAPLEEPKEGEEKPKEPRGIRCKWCGTVGQNHVRQTRARYNRIRYCRACCREFWTAEVVLP